MLNEELAADLAKFHKKDEFTLRTARVLQQISGDLLNLRCMLISCPSVHFQCYAAMLCLWT